MRKKDYELIAKTIKESSFDQMGERVIILLEVLAQNLADDFEATNKKFNRQKFLTACGIEASHSHTIDCSVGNGSLCPQIK